MLRTMVSMTIELSEERAAILRARAQAEGLSVSELVARALILDVDGEFDLTAEQEDRIIQAADDADRGHVISADDAMAALRALGNQR
jgi:hypothetical protein